MENLANNGVPAAQVPEEERRHRRLRMLKRAMLAYEGQFAGIPCVVRDMSTSGARIELSDTIALPRHFTLHVEIDGFKVECELVWQGLNFAGLRFIGEKEATAIARKQVLKTSENALSEQFLREEAERRRREEQSRVPSQSGPPPSAPRPVQKTPTFGKRKFEG